MSPVNFDWAKNFLSSKAGKLLEGNGGVIDFSLPRHCPTSNGLPCSSTSHSGVTIEDLQENDASDVLEAEQEQETPITKGTKSRKRAPPPVVDTEVRRSPRLKPGYKDSKPLTCLDKKCLACSPSPPTVSPKLIKNLGTQLCGLDPELMDGPALKKGRKGKPIARKVAAKKAEEPEADGSSKKEGRQDDDPGKSSG